HDALPILSAFGLPLGLCLRPTARGRAGGPVSPPRAAHRWAFALVPGPGRERSGREFRAVLCRPSFSRRRRGAAISDRDTRDARLVQSTEPRTGIRHLEQRRAARHRDWSAAAAG